jgi:hypothetical protein
VLSVHVLGVVVETFPCVLAGIVERKPITHLQIKMQLTSGLRYVLYMIDATGVGATRSTSVSRGAGPRQTSYPHNPR